MLLTGMNLSSVPEWWSKKIKIAAIRKIKETRTPISAPAPSLDRLEIFDNRFDSVIISPKNKSGFISLFNEVNPMIDVMNLLYLAGMQKASFELDIAHLYMIRNQSA